MGGGVGVGASGEFEKSGDVLREGSREAEEDVVEDREGERVEGGVKREGSREGGGVGVLVPPSPGGKRDGEGSVVAEGCSTPPLGEEIMDTLEVTDARWEREREVLGQALALANTLPEREVLGQALPLPTPPTALCVRVSLRKADKEKVVVAERVSLVCEEVEGEKLRTLNPVTLGVPKFLE